MIETLLQNLDTLLLLLFAICALVAAALMIVLRQPMRVAMALISTMVFLGGIYGLLGVHFIAAFQVLIYVGAVMVFMVYVIMLLEVRESEGRRYSGLLLPGLVGFVLLVGAIGISIWRSLPAHHETAGNAAYSISQVLDLLPQRLLAALRADLGAAGGRRGGGAGGHPGQPAGRRQEAPWIGPNCCSAWRWRCSRWGCSA